VGNNTFNRKVTMYTAGAVAAAATAAGTHSARAAIIYTPGPFPLTVGNAVDVDFDNNGNEEFSIGHEREGNNANADRVLLKDLDQNGATGNAYVNNVGAFTAFPAALPAGATIGPAQSYGNGFSGNTANELVDEDFDNNGNFESYTGNFTPDNITGNPQYIGVKFLLNDAGNIHYGWIGVDINNAADLTGNITGFAYESADNTPITAAAGVPEPSSALAILALGAAGVAMRRRQGKPQT
jgi:PEP-CTERM motif